MTPRAGRGKPTATAKAEQRFGLADHDGPDRARGIQREERRAQAADQAETDNTFLLDPAISPDGERLVYVVQPPPKIEAGVYDAGSDVWVANRDGSDAHVVFEHAQPNQLIRFPQWQDDAKILAVVQEIGPVNGVTTVCTSWSDCQRAAASGRR